MAKNSSPSSAPKTGAHLQTTWRSAKNAEDALRQQGHRPPVQMYCNCGTFTVFLTSEPFGCGVGVGVGVGVGR